MSRPLKIEFEDAWYHVMSRSTGYRNIYQSIKSRMIFIELLVDASSLFGVEIHGKIALYGYRKWAEEKLLTIAMRYNCRSHSLVSKRSPGETRDIL